MSGTQDTSLTLEQEDDVAFRILFEDFRIVTQGACDEIDVTVTVKDGHGDTLLGESVSGAVS